ncbi:hypothetical protein Tco_0040030 [Tanacetum coccineum]
MENQVVWESRQEDLSYPNLDASVFFGPQRNPNEPPRYLYNKDFLFFKKGNTEEKKYVLSVHKIHATTFPEEVLEEKMIRWVRVFKTFNEEARLSIQHWKDSWHKKMYKIKHMKVRDDPKELFCDYSIVETRRGEGMFKDEEEKVRGSSGVVVMEVRVTQSSDQEDGEDCGFDANKEEVMPKVDDVSLVDGVFDVAFGGDRDEDFVIGEGLVVSSSLLVKSTNSFLSRMIVSLIFLKGLKEEAWGEAMEVKEE